VFVIDPKIPTDARRKEFHCIEKIASEGMIELKKILLNKQA